MTSPSFSVVLLAVLGSLLFAASAEPICPAAKKCIARLAKGWKCDRLPVPQRAVISSLPAGKPYELRRLRPGVWFLRDLGYNGLIAYSNGHVVIMDAPDSHGGLNKEDGSGTRVTDAVEELLGRRIPSRIDLVYSHSHYDHMGAGKRVIVYFRKTYPHTKIRILGTAKAAAMIRASSTKRAIVPTKIIDSSGGTIWMRRGLRIDMHMVGGHAGKDLALHIPPSGKHKGVIMHVDVVFPKWSPFTTMAFTDSVDDFLRVHDRLLKFDFDFFVGGHIMLGERQDVVDSKQFTEDLIQAARDAHKMVTDEDRARMKFSNFFVPGTLEFGNIWFLFVTAGRNLEANACSRIMIEKWGCKVGGLASTIFSHCFEVITYVGFEY